LLEVCGDAALAAEPGDPDALAAAIDDAVYHPDPTLRERGITRARGYSWDHARDALVAALHAAME
jgi:hypothetical protein